MDNPSAFPTTHYKDHRDIIDGGMSLRDWFAGQALPSVLTVQFEVAKTGAFENDKHAHENAANKAYAIADAMLKERSK